MSKRVLIADDNPVMRLFIRSALEIAAGVEVCGEAVDGVEAVQKANALRPDLVVLDFSMPRMHGLEAGFRLKEIMPGIRLVLFTLHKDSIRESDVARAGIDVVVSKTDGMEALITEVRGLLHAGAAGA